MKHVVALLPFLAVLGGFSSCGDIAGNGDVIQIDPGFFEGMRFDCDPGTTDVPSCPPFACDVDENGSVSNCTEGCEVDPGSSVQTVSFEFKGPEGVDLCAPRECDVDEQNAAPTCSEDCSEDDRTSFLFGYSCD